MICVGLDQAQLAPVLAGRSGHLVVEIISLASAPGQGGGGPAERAGARDRAELESRASPMHVSLHGPQTQSDGSWVTCEV